METLEEVFDNVGFKRGAEMKAQGGLETLLLIGGAVLVAVILITLLLNITGPENSFCVDKGFDGSSDYDESHVECQKTTGSTFTNEIGRTFNRSNTTYEVFCIAEAGCGDEWMFCKEKRNAGSICQKRLSN